MVCNFSDKVAYLNEIIDRVFVMSRMSTVQEINQFWQKFFSKGIKNEYKHWHRNAYKKI